MAHPLHGLDIFEEGSEGRNLIFQTFLDRFLRPQGQGLGAPTGQQGVARRNVGLVNQFNRPGFSNLFGQAQTEFFGRTGTAVSGQETPTTFTEFLNNDFNLGRRTRRAPTSQTGRGISRLTSPARFLFNS